MWASGCTLLLLGADDFDKGDRTVSAEAASDSVDHVSDAGEVKIDERCGADIMADPANCGACAHDCVGGACSAGRCQPVLLTNSESDLDVLRIQGGEAVYRTGRNVRKIPVDGGLQIALSGDAYHGILEVEPTSYFVWHYGDIVRKDLSSGSELARVEQAGAVGGLSVVDGGLFFVHARKLDWLPLSLDAGALESLAELPTTSQRIAVNDTAIFYVLTNGVIGYVTRSSGVNTTLEVDQVNVSSIAVTQDAIFWLANVESTSGVLRVRRFGAGGTTELASFSYPSKLAIDSDYVYVTVRGTPPDFDDGSLVRVSRENGEVESLVTQQKNIDELALSVDGRVIIYTLRGIPDDAGVRRGGSILSVAK